ncbi:unnamed protein product [Rotaria magnacalcarata]|uniref:Uncharacterized protein n=1 Tax=Rotaria magnacalcarata TaxID=392030 RepID=A0A8S3HXU2_9BILA|nr:unnamed protein product [Rotaria magnacalcarata]
MNREFVNRYDRRQACSYKKQILAVKRTLGNQNLILRPIDKDVIVLDAEFRAESSGMIFGGGYRSKYGTLAQNTDFFRKS